MKFSAFIFAIACFTTGCVSDDEYGIITPGCDGPPSDPHRVCEGGPTGGGGGGGGGSSGGGGGALCNGVSCPSGMICYQRGLSQYCGRPPGTRCQVGQEPPGTRCYTDINGYCQCFLTDPPPNTFTSEPTQ